MAQIIAMFNHKGGVSKTTSTFHLGWMLAEQGAPVLLVDADPQCNLSGLIMDFGGPDRFEQFYIDDPQRNIMAGLSPAFESKPQLIEPMDPVPVEGCPNLYLMPGHLRLSEYETTLSMAHEFSASLLPLKNVPGSIYQLFEATAAKIGAEIVVVDMNPSLSAINQNILMTASYFIIPTSPDYFSVMALNSLAAVLPRWAQWYRTALANPVLKESVYKLPDSSPKLLGTIIQNYRPRDNRPTSAFLPWIDKIQETVRGSLGDALRAASMAYPVETYGESLMKNGLTLAMIPNFNSLVASSQAKRKPVFALTQEDVRQAGTVWDTTSGNIDAFREKYGDLAGIVYRLISTNNVESPH